MAQELRDEGFSEVVFVTVGKKGAGTIAFRGEPIDRAFQGFSIAPTYADAEQVTEHLVGRFTGEEVNRVVIVYNAFKSVLEQRVTTEQLLPVERSVVLDEDEEDEEAPELGRGLALFEPDPEDFLKALLPTFLDTTIYRALLESAAAELAARRTAMRNATDNAGTLIDEYTLAMNRARQAAITQEILEVVAGADALS
jgi:F-type H+-transporting ATPase subunit gamma